MDPVLRSKPQLYQQRSAEFPDSSIKDVTRLPDQYVDCEIVNSNQIRVYNTAPVRGGQTLMAGPVYEFLVDEIVNPAKTPTTASNLWRIVAYTTSPLGRESWATEG